MSRWNEGRLERSIAMTESWEKKIDEFVNEIPELIKKFRESDYYYKKGPDLYFYKKTMELRKSKPLVELFDDGESDRYIELIYATLVAWNMNTRRAKMEYFDSFKASILANKISFVQLSSQRLETLNEATIKEVKKQIEGIQKKMHLMYSARRLVSNSKVMHLILPDLVMSRRLVSNSKVMHLILPDLVIQWIKSMFLTFLVRVDLIVVS